MPLKYNVSSLLQEPVGSTREYEIDDPAPIDVAGTRFPRVTGGARLLRTEHGVLVDAGLLAVQHEPCSRCLREMEVPLRLEIQDEFFATADAETGAALPPPKDPEAFRLDASHTLDLAEAIRQSWTAALPMQTLCRPGCQGLCPQCGQDLNKSICSCTPEEDERWSALRELVRSEEGQ